MYKKAILLALSCFFSLVISGCAVKTYSVFRDRVDQDLYAGNRGYLAGEAKISDEKPRSTTRKVQVVELELRHPIRAKEPFVPEPGISPDIFALESRARRQEVPSVIAIPVEPQTKIVMKQYTVQKSDTLQSISQRFYGTTKQWKKIYNANKKVLKAPDKIYPGQIINIPLEEIVGK